MTADRMKEFTVTLRAAECGETPSEERVAAVVSEAGGDYGMIVEVTGVWAVGPADSYDNDRRPGSAPKEIVGSSMDHERGALSLFIEG